MAVLHQAHNQGISEPKKGPPPRHDSRGRLIITRPPLHYLSVCCCRQGVPERRREAHTEKTERGDCET